MAYTTIPVESPHLKVKIDEYICRALIDTGAQMSVISERLAFQLNLTKMIDSRYRGSCIGVGTSNIVGKIYNLPLFFIKNPAEEPIMIPIDLHVSDFPTEMLLLGMDFLEASDATINIRSRSMTFFSNQKDSQKINFTSPDEFKHPISYVSYKKEEILFFKNKPLYEESLNQHLLYRILTNILNDLENMKYRQIKLDAVRGSNIHLLKLLGFKSQNEFMVLSPSSTDKELLSFTRSTLIT